MDPLNVMRQICFVMLCVQLLTAVEAAQWRHGTPLPVPTGGHAAGLSDGRILLAGGTTWHGGKKYWLREVRAYDPKLDRWTKVGMLPEPLGDPVSIDGGNALYVIGGSDATKATRHGYRLRLEGNRLVSTRLPDLPEARVYAAGARVGSRLYVMGGGADPKALDSTTDLLCLDPGHPERGWQALAPLPGPARVVHAAASAGRYLYVFGGCYLDEKKVVRNLADAYRYDTRTRQWERLPDMPIANRGLTALGVGSRHVLLFGGFTATEEECAGKGDDFGFADQVLSYDTITRSYKQVGVLPVATCCAAPVRVGDDLFLLGGEPVKRQRGDWVWISALQTLLP